MTKKSIFWGPGGSAENSSKTWSKVTFLLLHRRKSGQKVVKKCHFPGGRVGPSKWPPEPVFCISMRFFKNYHTQVRPFDGLWSLSFCKTFCICGSNNAHANYLSIYKIFYRSMTWSGSFGTRAHLLTLKPFWEQMAHTRSDLWSDITHDSSSTHSLGQLSRSAGSFNHFILRGTHIHGMDPSNRSLWIATK